MTMRFKALDVETANADMSSICQVGIATFEAGKVVEEWKSYIDPKDYFDIINIGIHGIDHDVVKESPTFKDIYSEISRQLSDETVVTHSHFDRVALHQAANSINQPTLTCRWLDTARIARRTWNEISRSGYGLKNVCEMIGYEFQHHDALEDAKAAGHILLAAQEKTGLDVEGWISRVKQGINPKSSSATIRVDGNPEGPLYGEMIVFTGALQIPRSEAAKIAADIGVAVSPSVTKKTTILCVGDQDIARLAGHSKSSKHRKAEDLIQKGHVIRIIRETDFIEMSKYSV